MVSTQEPIRFSTFNASLNRNTEGQLVTDLSTPDNIQAQTVAEIIQRTSPDVILINEFDYDASGTAAQLFQQNYLSLSQNGATPVEYPYFYVAPSNTGVASGFDLDNNGTVETTPGAPGYGNDAFGFGNFPGQYGMVVYSKYPLDTENIRTFQNFLWQDMPGALLPDDPTTPEANDWYSPEELDAFRLSSKNHWDIPINVNGEIVHVLASHPTPPVFDGPEDRNGTRNHDEIRFWSDYVTPGEGDYIYDDAGNQGGLTSGSRFVIMGDQNADPNDGDSVDEAILQLLDNPLINTTVTPTSEGGPEQSELQGGANTTPESDPAFDTADFADSTPGNLRADYVLPSNNLRIVDAEVFWPKSSDPQFPLVGVFDPSIPGGFPSSDHRLVWVDVEVTPTVLPTVETPPVIDVDEPANDATLGDADDPAIYVHPTDASQSFVIGSLKDGGLQVYDLGGQVLQSIAPEDIRYNNVDVLYGFELGGESVDLAIASDRNNDTLAIFLIDPNTRQLTDITADNITESIFGIDDGEQTAYGLTTYQSPISGESYIFVSQREGNQVAQLKLVDDGGQVNTEFVRTLTVPIPEGGELEDAQTEGMVADKELGYLYVAQENVGIWKFAAEPEGETTGELIDEVYPNGSHLQADAEGLTIYYGENGTGYLLASSQGDSTFAAYSREGNNEYLGSFQIGESNGIDGVQNSDGADVINVPLGDEFPFGLLVVHDGSNDPAVLVDDDGELENASTNFKFVPWEDVANAFSEPLAITPNSFDPRNPTDFEIVNGTSDADTIVGTPDDNRINGFGGNDLLAGDLGNDEISGGDGDDILRGDLNSREPGGTVGGDDIIYGGAGNDRIGGKAGNDSLYGDAGDDQIWGDAGNDLIRGGLGNDILVGDDFSGGTGSDTFVLAVGEGIDTIQDFQLGVDFLGLTEDLSFGQIAIAQEDSNTLIRFNDETLAILNGITANTITESAFTLI